MSRKPPLISTKTGTHRVQCVYCKRPLTPSLPECGTSLTFDHVKAEVDGGIRKLPCCRTCNQLKGNLTPEDWFWFIGAHPRWWKEFRHASQVVRVVREFRFGQAKAGQKPYRLKGRRELPFLGSYQGNRS